MISRPSLSYGDTKHAGVVEFSKCGRSVDALILRRKTGKWVNLIIHWRKYLDTAVGGINGGDVSCVDLIVAVVSEYDIHTQL